MYSNHTLLRNAKKDDSWLKKAKRRQRYRFYYNTVFWIKLKWIVLYKKYIK